MKKKKLVIFGAIVIIGLIGLKVNSYLQAQKANNYPNQSATSEVCADGVNKETSDSGAKEITEKPIPIGTKVGERMPNLKLTTSDGKTEYLYDLMEGKEKFILNFSADWCSDSQREKDKLDQVYGDLAANKVGVGVVYVNLSKADSDKQTSIPQIENYLTNSNFSFPTYIDYNDKLQKEFAISSVPTNIILDKNAIIKGHTEEIDMDNLLLENSDSFREEK